MSNIGLGEQQGFQQAELVGIIQSILTCNLLSEIYILSILPYPKYMVGDLLDCLIEPCFILFYFFKVCSGDVSGKVGLSLFPRG